MHSYTVISSTFLQLAFFQVSRNISMDFSHHSVPAYSAESQPMSGYTGK